jgi:hypothetical protein
MKKYLIGALVGSLILFIWQFLSWTILNLHLPMQTYTPKQTEVLNFLNENLEEGFYYLPTTPPGSKMEDTQKLEEQMAGKPWAQIYYHDALKTNMGANMARGVFVNFLAVMILIWMLLKMGNVNFQTIFLSSLGVGLIGYLTGVYTNSIWFETKTMADLIDTFVSFGFLGVWLAWWLRRD